MGDNNEDKRTEKEILADIYSSVHTIKNIIVFYLLLSIVGAIFIATRLLQF